MSEDNDDDFNLRYHLRGSGGGYETGELQDRACDWAGFRVCDGQSWAYDFPWADLGGLYSGARRVLLEEAHTSRFLIHLGATKLCLDLKRDYW